MSEKLKVIVIGGGMAGTAAAQKLTEHGFEVTIIENNDYLGGRIHSITHGNYTFETGAGFVTSGYESILGLIQKAELDQYLVKRSSGAAIVHQAELQQVLSAKAIFGNVILPPRAKLRLLSELTRAVRHRLEFTDQNPRRMATFDTQNLSSVFKDQPGQELLTRVLQPILGGYFYWSAGDISEAMLLWLLRVALRFDKTYILSGGLQQLPEYAARKSTVLLGHAVRSVVRTIAGYTVSVESTSGARVLQADAIVCATTATVVPKICNDLTQTQHEFFSSIKYSSTATLAQVFDGTITAKNLSVAFTRQHDPQLDAATVVSEVDAANKPVTLLKLFASGAVGAELCLKDDVAIKVTLQSSAKPMYNLLKDQSPSYEYLQRWSEALPIFEPGHFTKLQAFHDGQIEDADQRLVFAGDYLGGPFIEGAYTSGVQAAERLIRKL